MGVCFNKKTLVMVRCYQPQLRGPSHIRYVRFAEMSVGITVKIHPWTCSLHRTRALFQASGEEDGVEALHMGAMPPPLMLRSYRILVQLVRAAHKENDFCDLHNAGIALAWSKSLTSWPEFAAAFRNIASTTCRCFFNCKTRWQKSTKKALHRRTQT